MRFALRSLARTPGFAGIAILTLAVGIGTNTTIFAIVDELAFKSARAHSADNVFLVSPLQIPDYETIVANVPDGVAAIAAYESSYGGLLQIPGRAERVIAQNVAGGYAAVHNVRAQAGRWIDDKDNVGGVMDPTVTYDGVTAPYLRGQAGADVIVISDRIWREWFNASPEILGRQISLSGRPMRVIGVAPQGFQASTDIWTPFGSRRLLTRQELDKQRNVWRPRGWVGAVREPQQPTIRVLIRKAPDVANDVIAARLNSIVNARTATPDMPASRVAIERARGNGDTRFGSTAYTILGFASLIFVAACANLGNMLFARATEREGDLAVRLSLGATRFEVFSLLFAEALLICAAASVVGLLFTWGVLQLFTDAFPAFQIQYWRRIPLDLSIDWRIVGYATAGGLVAAAIVGAGSLWRSSRVSLQARLAAAGPAVVAKTEGRTVRTMLVSVQVTAAVLLLIATGMLLENSSGRLNVRLQYDTRSLATARIELPATYDESRGQHFFDQLIARVRTIDGVTAAGLADAVPQGEAPRPRGGDGAFVAEAPPQGLSGVPRRLNGTWMYVSPGMMNTLGLEVTRGRDVLDNDRAGTDPVVIVGESTATRLWPGQDPLGKQMTCCGKSYLRRVVGVVADPVTSVERQASHNVADAMQELKNTAQAGNVAFIPAAQQYQSKQLVVVRSDTPRAVLPALRAAVAAVDPMVPVFDVGPADATQFARVSSESAVRLLAGALGLIALGIAVFGVYAIVSYSVSRRSREFGLRLALGSTRRQIVKLVIDYAIHIILIGLLPGVLFASLGTRYFQAELRELHPNGPTVWIAVPIMMLAVGVMAAYIPARRASRIDPYRSLKEL
jgi:putative ABC transport system permease protein